MKREILAASALVLVMALVLTSTALAELPGSGWWSGEQVQNVGGTDATVQITAYGSSGNYSGDERTVASGASTTYLPADFTDMPTGFQGSAVVSSDQPIKAIVNVTNRKIGDYGETGGLAAAQYQGVDGTQADTTVSFPLVKNDYINKTTTFYIQNAGSSAANILATYQVAAGTYTKTYSIDPNQMVVVNPADAGVPDGELGALTVTSDQPVAGAVMEHPSAGGTAEQLQSTRGFVPADYDTTIYAPIVKRGFVNRHTGIQVQNVSDAAVDVYVTYYGSTGCSGEFSNSTTGLAAGASHTFFDDENMPEGCLASAVITATGQIAGVVNETFYPSVPSGQAQAQVTYSCISDGSATTKVAVPLYKNKFQNKTTGLQVQNVGDAAATVDLVFTDDSGTSYTLSGETIEPGAAKTYLELDNYTGSWDAQPGSGNLLMGAMVTSDQPVVAIANESVYPYDGSVVVQDKNNYEGFNLE
jgi:hypothetical protein